MAATPSTHLPPARLRAPRSRSALLAWVLWGFSAALLLGFIPLFVEVTLAASQTPTLFPVQLAQYLRPSVSDWIALPLTLVAVLAFSTLGALIVTRQPKHRIGWLFCAVGLLTMTNLFAVYYACYSLWVQPGALPGGLAAAWVQNWIWTMLLGLFVGFLPLLYPTGRLLSRRWRPVGWLSAGVVVLNAGAAAFHPGALWNHLEPAQITNPLGIGVKSDLATAIADFPFGLLLLMIPLAATSLLLRWRRAQGEERLQLKWFAFVGAILAGLFVTQGLVQYILVLATPTEEQIFDITWNVTFVGLPLATGLAILNYHLYAIDLLINRTLVYGALTALVVGVYVLVVGSLGIVFQASGNLLIALLATGIVAVLFQPVRDRLQRAVNHLLYGDRDDPHVVLARLGSRLEATLAPDAVLPIIVETVAQALKLPYATIRLKREEQFTLAASYGVSGEDETLLRVPLLSQSEYLGELLLAPRAPGESFSPADRVLLQDLARHIGVALRAVRLTTALQQLTGELQRSRSHLVTLREEERRRLRRDLHDGLGSALTSMTFQLDAACNLLERDPLTVRTLLHEVKQQARESIANIRRLVYNLRPPILDEWGLVAALREQVAQYPSHTVQVDVFVPASLPPLPAAVEVAAYRITLEALANVMRHAQATRCTIRLEVREEALIVEIQDNGRGVSPDVHAGVGISAMRERAAELGGCCLLANTAEGGTRVSARLPFLKKD